MRRALIVTIGSAAAVVAIIQYRSSGNVRALLNVGKTTATTVASSTQATHTPMSVSPGTTLAPGTTMPGTTMPGVTMPPTTTPGITIPPTTAPRVHAPTTVVPTTAGPNGQFVGSTVQFVYGRIEARVTVRGGKIVAVDFPVQADAGDPTSKQINTKALPILTRELISTQSLRLDGVTGATYTSRAFAQTVGAALAKAGL